MSVPSASTLLRQFDSLCHDERMRRLGLLAQQYGESPEMDRLITELEAGESSEAYLAVRLASLTGRVEALRRGLVSGSVLVMQSAAKHLVRVTDDVETLVGAYQRAVPAVRRRLLQHIVRWERTEAAEALFADVLEQAGPSRAVSLLPVCRAETVCGTLADYEHAVQHWKSLAIRHPNVVLELLSRRLEAANLAQRATIWGQYREAVHVLYADHAGELARLALEYGPADGLPSAIEAIIGALASRVPELTFALLTAEQNRSRLQSYGLPRGLLGRVRSLSLDHRRELARLLGRTPTHLAALLARHAPSERADLLEYARQDIEEGRAPWHETLLDVLPHDARHREARRILERDEVRTNRMQTLALSAYLPFEVARSVLEEGARASEANERAVALHSLVRCAGLNRRGIDEALKFCQKIENDQDPVRQGVYRALATFPPTVLEDAHAEPLFWLVAHAFAARDTSWMTRSHIQDFSVRLLQAHALQPRSQLFSVALDLVEQLAKQSSYLRVDLEHRLPRGAEKPLIKVLEKPLRDSVQRENYALLFLFARALGRRAWDSGVVQSLLEKATRARPDGIANTAISFWLEPPGTRDERVVELLRRDRSSIRLRAVFQHVHRRRQDLLDPYLTRRPILGRYMSGETIYIVPAWSGFFRWLPRQQRAYGDLLDKLIGDEGASTWNRTSALRVRARLLTTRLEEIEPWMESNEVTITEAALHGASHLDCPSRSCSLLAEHLASSRARVAICSMYRCASYTPSAAVHRLLAAILGRDRLKVTVEKEVVRLLSRFPSAENVQLLFDYVQRGDLHSDVKIAVGRAARNLLRHQPAWEVVEKLAQDDDRYVVASLLGESWARFSRDDARRYLDIILDVVGHEDAFAREQAIDALGRWAPVDPQKVAEVSAKHAIDLDCGCWRAAVHSLVKTSRHGDVQEHVLFAARALRSRGLDDQPEAEAERDLPARQRLHMLVGEFAGIGTPWTERLRPLLLSLDEELSADETLASLRVELRLSAVRWKGVEAAVEDLQRLLADVTTTSLGLAELSGRFTAHLSRDLGSRDEQLLYAVSLKMADTEEGGLRRLCVALLAVIGPRLCWPEELVSVLCRLRRDRDIAVRAAALQVFVHDE
ncbi:hypothetical protein FRC96_19155 [Lujinxingia vulgaris]|uniref:HEAT repeat domain-containing protein n=1 Tax=Lujinxingia vulgaris TaxID=2600176 RepID=A0A5C6X602_9DELT|nr:hypothetical protein [Lujinxingia vulgaris]TXD32022.1 hypothetical protein FRC96_19155 [Lujinxingia vulgaris]